jgi:tRNA (Thr-GGU) A37 N-methylase
LLFNGLLDTLSVLPIFRLTLSGLEEGHLAIVAFLFDQSQQLLLALAAEQISKVVYTRTSIRESKNVPIFSLFDVNGL